MIDGSKKGNERSSPTTPTLRPPLMAPYRNYRATESCFGCAVRGGRWWKRIRTDECEAVRFERVMVDYGGLKMLWSCTLAQVRRQPMFESWLALWRPRPTRTGKGYIRQKVTNETISPSRKLSSNTSRCASA